MWTILKYKKSELNFLKHDLRISLGAIPEIFIPKFRYQKLKKNKLRFFEDEVLEDYLICYHKKFEDEKIFTTIKNIRGLKYFLTNSKANQKEIIKFVDYCKNNQDRDGYLMQSFFDITKKTKAKFLSGPFAQMVFDILEKKGKKLKILIKNLNITISKNSTNLLYS